MNTMLQLNVLICHHTIVSTRFCRLGKREIECMQNSFFSASDIIKPTTHMCQELCLAPKMFVPILFLQVQIGLGLHEGE